MSGQDQVLQLARKRGVIRARDLKALDLPRQYLSRLCRQGKLKRIGRGLYMLPDADVTEHHTLVEVSKRVPHGVVCLLSALQFHELTTQLPFEVWLAIENKSRRPQGTNLPLRIVYMSGDAFETGIEEHRIEGVPVRVYGVAKTVADCFKYRNKIGLDVALEALQEYLKNRNPIDKLRHYAEICRVSNVMQPYLEALA